MNEHATEFGREADPLANAALLGSFPGILTLSEVARILRCSKTHICKAVRGEITGLEPIPAIPFGRRKLIRRETLFSWIERNECASFGVKIPSSERGTRRRAKEKYAQKKVPERKHKEAVRQVDRSVEGGRQTEEPRHR
jgi:hypothetical protein